MRFAKQHFRAALLSAPLLLAPLSSGAQESVSYTQPLSDTFAEVCFADERLSRDFKRLFTSAFYNMHKHDQVVAEALQNISSAVEHDQSGPYRMSYCAAMPVLLDVLESYPRESNEPFFDDYVRNKNIEMRTKIFETIGLIILEDTEFAGELDKFFQLLEEENDKALTAAVFKAMFQKMNQRRGQEDPYVDYRTHAIAEQVLDALETDSFPNDNLNMVKTVFAASYSWPEAMDRLFEIAQDKESLLLTVRSQSAASHFPRDILTQEAQDALISMYLDTIDNSGSLDAHVVQAMKGLKFLALAKVSSSPLALQIITASVENNFGHPRAHGEAVINLRDLTLRSERPEQAIAYFDLWTGWLSPESQVLGYNDKGRLKILTESQRLAALSQSSQSLQDTLGLFEERYENYPFLRRPIHSSVRRDTIYIDARKCEYLLAPPGADISC